MDWEERLQTSLLMTKATMALTAMNDWYDENDLQGNLDKVRDAIQSIFEELSKE